MPSLVWSEGEEESCESESDWGEDQDQEDRTLVRSATTTYLGAPIHRYTDAAPLQSRHRQGRYGSACSSVFTSSGEEADDEGEDGEDDVF